MPGVVVFLGFTILTLSILGAAAGSLILFGGPMFAEMAKMSPDELRLEMRNAAVPEPMIEDVMAQKDIPVEVQQKLERPQLMAISSAKIALLSKDLSKDIDPKDMTQSAQIILGVSLLGIAAGWFLRMKRDVLRCSECGVAVPGETP